MRPTRRLAALLPILAVASLGSGLAACGGGDDRGDDRGDVQVSLGRDTTAAGALPLGEGDVAVTSTDGVVVLALVGDTVRMQLTDSLRQHVKAQVDSELGEQAGALGGMLARTVGKTVAGAMGFVVRVPVDQVENVRYEEGHIRFESHGNTKFSMGTPSDGDDGKASGARFSEADGRRFVEAVKARQSARRANL